MIDKELIHQAAEDIDIFQADLTEEYERLCKPQPRKLHLWPLAVAACVAGFVAIFLLPPKEATEDPQVAFEEEMYHFQCTMFNEAQDLLTTESFEEHQQRIKKKGERLAAYISQELKDYDNKVQL